MLELVVNAASSVIALSVAIFVMYRTNRANRAISDKANRISVAMNITQMTSKFCLSAFQLYDLCSRHNKLCEMRRQETDMGQFEAFIDDLKIKIREKEDETSVLFFNLEIMKNTHDALKDTLCAYENILNDAKQGCADEEKILRSLSDLRKDISNEMKEYIG